MKKIFLLLLLAQSIVYSQYRGTRQNGSAVRTEDYVTNSPGNSISNSKLIAYYKDSTAIAFNYPSVQFWNFKNNRNDGNPTSILWVDNDGYMKRSPIPAFITTETDPVWNLEKVNYYDKTASDARYLQCFIESDPIWSSVAPSYRTHAQNLLLFEPIFIKNTAFNKNFGTASGDVAQGNDSRINNGQTAFGWGNHALVGYLLASVAASTYQPIGNYVNTSRTITINGVTFDLSANRTFSVGTVTSVTAGTGLSGGTITSSGTISIPNSGVTAGTYEYITVNSLGIVTAGYNSVISDLSARTSGTAYQASNTSRIYDLDFTITINIGAGLISASDAQVVLETSANGTTGWSEYARSRNANAGVLAAQNIQTAYIEAKSIPAGYYYRLVYTNTSGTTSWTYVKGHEILRR